MVAVGEEVAVEIDEVIVGHAGDIVHNDLVGFRTDIGNRPGVMGLVYIIYMVAIDG